MIKRFVVGLAVFFSFFGISLNIYGNSLDLDVEAKKLSDFIFWQKQLSWDHRNEAGYFESLPPGIIEALEKVSVSSGDDVKFSNELYKLSVGDIKSSVEPLTGQWGIESKNTGLSEQLSWTYDELLPSFLFGEKFGASPLYCRMTHGFSIKEGGVVLEENNSDVKKYLLIRVYDNEAPADKNRYHVYEENIKIDFNKEIKIIGGHILRDQYGLESWLQYQNKNGVNQVVEVYHRSNNLKYSYVIKLVDESKKASSLPSYVINFSPLPPKIIPLVGQTGINTNNLSLNDQVHWAYDGVSPTVLFGEEFGAKPLFCETQYSFGIRVGKSNLNDVDIKARRYLRVKIYDDDSSENDQPIYEEKLWYEKYLDKSKNVAQMLCDLDFEPKQYLRIKVYDAKDSLKKNLDPIYEENIWYEKNLDKSENVLSIGSKVLRDTYGLENWLQYTDPKSNWGVNDDYGLVFTHSSDSTQYSYVVELINVSDQSVYVSYALNFSDPPVLFSDEINELAGYNTDLVIPLTGQRGINARYMPPDEKSQWLYNNNLPFVLFGEKVGASPLYCGMTYRFGVRTGEHVLNAVDFETQKHLRIEVYDNEAVSSNQPIHSEDIRIPLNKFEGNNKDLKNAFGVQWYEEYIDKAGGLISVGSEALQNNYGLESWLQHTGSKSAWGNNNGSGLILSHRSNNTRYSYVIHLLNSSEKVFKTLYALNFSPTPPAEALILQNSLFMWEPKPSGYWGILTDVNNGQLKDMGNFKLFDIGKCDARYCDSDPDSNELMGQFNIDMDPEENDLEHINVTYKKTDSNTPVSYDVLNKLVSERRDPLVLVSYVQNNIELVDGAGIPDKLEALTIHPERINRSPLITFLEGQGSPWEQCALLVYLLRQAGFAVAFVESEKEPMFFSKDDFSRLLRLKLIGGASFSKSSPLARVRYPWVAYYDENNKKWIHLFPWIKDTKVEDGYDLYGLMPEGYKSGVAWARRYLENDPEILKYIKEDGNDTAAVLLKRFVEDVAKKRGIAPDKIGVRFQNIKKSFAKWEDFPKPIYYEGKVKFLDSIADRDEIYTAIKFEIASLENPHKKIVTQGMRLADIYNRALYVYFDPISDDPNETRHEMVFRMEGVEGFFAASGFNLAGAQERRIELDGSDRKIKVQITYDNRTRELRGSYPEMTVDPVYESSYTISKGELAAICINVGRVTKEMLNLHVERFDSDKAKARDIDILGRLAYLAGMSFFAKATAGVEILTQLHKIDNVKPFRVGLSELRPDFAEGSVNLNSKGEFIGKPKLQFPQVNMRGAKLKYCENEGIRPDIGEETTTVTRDYNILYIVDSSSNEHQVINDFYGTKNAVSTAKLLQLAHKRHVESGGIGSGFLVFTRGSFEEAINDPEQATAKYFSHIKGLNLRQLLSTEWEDLAKAFYWDKENRAFKVDDSNEIISTQAVRYSKVMNSHHTVVYMTPGPVYSDDGDPNDTNNLPSYKGVGTFVFNPNFFAALISSGDDIINGGYGERLPEGSLDPANIPNLDISLGKDGLKVNGLGQGDLKSGNYFGMNSPRDFDDFVDSIPKDAFDDQYNQMKDRWNDDSCYQDQKEFNQDNFKDFQKEIINNGALTPEAQEEHKSWGQTVGDPVDIITGAFQEQEEDLSLNGPIQLKLKRNYSSSNPFSSRFGYGWKSNLVPYLVLSSNVIQAAELDGTVVTYRKVDENNWKVLPKDNPYLAMSGDNSLDNNLFLSFIKRVEEDVGNNYYLYGFDGSIRHYRVRSFPISSFERKRPYLHGIEDAGGNKISFEYGENKDLYDYGQVRKIVNDQGNFVGFIYDEHEHIIEAYTRNGNRVLYSYDKFGDLRSVTSPDDTVVKYTYEHLTSNYSTHRIIRVEKAKGRLLINIYDKNGRVIEQKVTRKLNSPVTNVKFRYIKETSEDDPRSVREVEDAGGALTRYHLYGNLITKIIDPLENVIYQSWYLGDGVYWDAEKESIQNVSKDFSGLSNQLMNRIDNRGLRAYYKYDKKGALSQKLLEGEDLSGNGGLKYLVSDYSYYESDNLKSITNNNGKSIHYFYGDAQYPRLVTRVEKKDKGQVLSVNEYSYNNGLLVSESFYDPKDSDSRIEILYEYSVRRLPAKEIHEMGEGKKDVVINLEYDLQNNLSRRIEESGAYTKYQYNNMHRLIGVIKCDAKGKELAATYYYYNANGELEWVKGPGHEKDYIRLNYDAAGNQVFKAKWRFGIDDPLALEMKTVPIPGYQNFISQAIELKQFDDLARVQREFDPEGHVTEYVYDAVGQVTNRKVKDKLDGKILLDESYEYEAGGFISKTIYPDKSETKRFYTTNGLLKKEEFSDGRNRAWVYDGEGRIVEESTESGARWKITYDDLNRTVTRSELNTGITETRKHDLVGNIVEVINGNGHSVNYEYDKLGRIISEKVNSETAKYFYKYDELGNSIKEKVFANGAKSREIYNFVGRPLEISFYERDAADPTRKLKYEYHPEGRVCLVGGSEETRSCYMEDPSGSHLRGMEYFLGPSVGQEVHIAGRSYVYDRNNNLISYSKSQTADQFSYDGLGKMTKKVLRGGAPFSFEYDKRGRLIGYDLSKGLFWKREYKSEKERSERSIWANDNLAGYDYQDDIANNTYTTKDLNGYKFTYTKDQLGRLKEVSVDGADGYKALTSYSYDSADNVLEIREEFPSGDSLVKREYDEAGNIIHEVVSLNDEVVADWKQEWNSGNRISLTNNDLTTWNFQYNAFGQLKNLTLDQAGKKLDWSYDYSQAGLLKKRSTPWFPISYKYDAGGHIDSQSVGEVLFQEVSWRTDNKIEFSRFVREKDPLLIVFYKYNPQGRLIGEEGIGADFYLSTPSDAAEFNQWMVSQLKYNLDWNEEGGLGALTGVTNNFPSFYQRMTGEPQSEKSRRPNEETFTGLNPNRLTPDKITGFEDAFAMDTLNTRYDAMGRVVERIYQLSDKKQILKWDPDGHLLGVTLKNHQGTILSEWKAFYDGLGRRIRTIFTPYENGSAQNNKKITSTSFYDPEVEFLELGVSVQVGGNKPRIIWKVYGASINGFYGENNGIGALEAIVENDTNESFGIINSLEGDIFASVDKNNQLSWENEKPLGYGPTDIPNWEELVNANGAGQLADAIINRNIWRNKGVDPTGFMSFGARYYDPVTGRFLSCDPLGHESTPDLYSYTDGDPINNIDPDGRFKSEVYERIEKTLNILGDRLEDEYKYYSSLGWEDTKRLLSAGIINIPAAGASANIINTAVGAARFGELYNSWSRGFSRTEVGAKDVGKGGAQLKGKRTLLRPDPKAEGQHSVFKTTRDGKVYGYETFRPQTNPRNPNPWESVKRFDGRVPGSHPESHYNKVLKKDISTPHIHSRNTPGGIRPARKWEMPKND